MRPHGGAAEFAEGKAGTVCRGPSQDADGAARSPKFFAVRLFGLIRAELLCVGRELAAIGELGGVGDLFYLSFAELAAFAATRRRLDRPDCRAAGSVSPRGRRRQVPRLLLSDGLAFYAGWGRRAVRTASR